MVKTLINSTPELLGNKLSRFISENVPYISNPIISKGDTWIRVNDILIIEKNSSFVVSKNGKILNEFQNKALALVYAINFFRNNLDTCGSLKDLDNKLTKLNEEILRFDHHLKIAQKNKNIIKENIVSDRLSRVIYEQDLVYFQIQKLANSQYIL